MREGKYRGRSIESGEMVYGALWTSGTKASYILTWQGELGERLVSEAVRVNPSTVGEFTGKNGRYEGDILDLEDGDVPVIVKLCEDKARWIIAEPNGDYADDLSGSEGAKLIGNIHDNPELVAQ
jgi:hypothetical protein